MKNVVHVFCDCEQCEENQEIVNHVKDIGGENVEIVDRKYFQELEEKAEKWDLISKDLEVEEAKNTLIVEQLRKLLGNTTKNPEDCCQAFEYIRDTLQKIVREKNGTN